MRRLSANPKHWFRWFRRQIERLPPYPALLILVGPLAVVEPLKLATVFIAGEGHWITGGLVMAFAYAVSLFVTHWLFNVIKPKLLTLALVCARVGEIYHDPQQNFALACEKRELAV
jgi:hypothetical protein